MIPELRQKFNSEFSKDRYKKFIRDLESVFGYKIEFRIAETPVFLPEDLKNELFKASGEILSFLQSDDYGEISEHALPKHLSARGLVPLSDFPEMLALDFAVCKDDSGKLIPKLIELQGFPSLYCYQELINIKYREHFDIDSRLKNFFSNLDHDSYLQLLRDVLLGNSAPENVILLEIEPDKQKTRIDFSCTEKWLDIKPVSVTEIIKNGKDLYYTNNGRRIRIERIYNRVIFDELQKRKDLKLNFSFQDELNVKWIPHPNWFFRISKYTLPFLNPLLGGVPEGRHGNPLSGGVAAFSGRGGLNKYVPPSSFLKDLINYPDDLQNYILKPLYSFAGSGVIYNVTKEILDSIKDMQNYILQKKILYEPVIKTPDTPAKVEIRLLFLTFPASGGQREVPLPVNNIVRLSKGKMMGVDFNKDKTWVGSSIAYYL
jgi:hypothetical protein